jgi:DNA polymerase III subunit beta
MFSIIVKVDALKALLITAGEQDVRYYLNGICVDLRDTDRPMLVSSDGHRLTAYGAAKLEGDAVAGTYVIPRDALKTVKPINRTDGNVVIEIEPKNFTGQDGGDFTIRGAVNVTGKLIECRYIEWPRVVPNARTLEEITPAHFNFEYLGDIARIAKLLGCKHPLLIANGDAGACVLLGPDAFGVLMPLRATNANKEPSCVFPSWYPAVPKPKAVKAA